MKRSNIQALKPRRKTRTVMIKDIPIGSEHPVVVQTMTNTDTLDIVATVDQIKRCVDAGTELIRLTTQAPKHARALEFIRKGLKKRYNIAIPLIADVHFSKETAFEALKYADKIRLNPGNLLDKKLFQIKKYTDQSYKKEIELLEKSLTPYIKAAKLANIPTRIGSNWGSLSDRIVARYGNTCKAMVESSMEYLRVFKKYGYDDLVVAMKTSDPLTMIETNRLLVQKFDEEGMDYPIHLGVTEAGNAEDGRAKSIIGIGTMLLEGIGDTIRVSLTEPPENEIPVCYSILQATRRRITKAEIVSCPSCGRTNFDIERVTNQVKKELGNIKGLHLAIMGCVVNGLGEMADADFGYIGSGKGKVNLYYRKGLMKSNIPEEKAIEELKKLIEEKKQT